MTSMRVLPRGKGGRLLGVELDDELLAHRYVDLRPCRELAHSDLEAAFGGLEPRRGLSVERVEVVADDDHRARLVAQRDGVALANRVARDGDALAVDRDMAMAHELPSLGAARPPSGAEHDVVEPQLEQLEQVLTRHALAAVGLLVRAAELLLHQPVDAACLLLLAELQQVLGTLALPVAARLTRRVRAALDRALHGVALGALEVQLHPLAPAQAAHGTGVASHYAPPLRRTAAVVRHGGHILDAGHLDAGVLQ